MAYTVRYSMTYQYRYLRLGSSLSVTIFMSYHHEKSVYDFFLLTLTFNWWFQTDRCTFSSFVCLFLLTWELVLFGSSRMRHVEACCVLVHNLILKLK